MLKDIGFDKGMSINVVPSTADGWVGQTILGTAIKYIQNSRHAGDSLL